MKIGYDAKRFFNNYAGLGVGNRTIVSVVKKYFPQNDIVLFTTGEKYHPDSLPFLNNPQYDIVAYKKRFSSLWRMYNIYKDINEKKLDIYHGFSNEIPFSSNKLHCKKVVTIHDLNFLTYPHNFKFIDRLIYEIKTRYACKHADRIIATSENTKKDIIHFYKTPAHKIDVVYQSTNALFYEDDITKKDIDTVKNKYNIPQKFILNVGTIEQKKNLKLLFEAYIHLPKALQLPIVVVGTKTLYKNEIQEFMYKNAIPQDKVLWIHNLHIHRDLKAIYTLATVFVYPSFYEGFGMPVIEGLLMKVPVVTSNVSSLPEVGGPKSFYVDPYKAKELADALEKILSDEQLKQQMQEVGYDFALKHFSPQVFAKNVLQCYTKTLQ